MNKETYEAVKRSMELLNKYIDNDKKPDGFGWKDKQREFITQVENWIDEVKKEYKEDN